MPKRTEDETAYRITKIEEHWPPNRLRKSALGDDPEALRLAVEAWSGRAVRSPDGMGVGFVRLTVLNEKTGETGIIDISTSEKQLFITVPAL